MLFENVVDLAQELEHWDELSIESVVESGASLCVVNHVGNITFIWVPEMRVVFEIVYL